MNIGPDHLKDIINENYSDINIPSIYKKWFEEECHWKGRIQYNNINKFKIFFNGIIVENYLANNDDIPLIININPIGTKNKITIFDERHHGYNALLIENMVKNKFSEEIPFIDKDGKDIFEIIVWANYNIDFGDEFPNKKGLELTDGKIETVENIRRNAFDSFGIITKNELGNVYNILEIELA
jgi:hypothetical protein